MFPNPIALAFLILAVVGTIVCFGGIIQNQPERETFEIECDSYVEHDGDLIINGSVYDFVEIYKYENGTLFFSAEIQNNDELILLSSIGCGIGMSGIVGCIVWMRFY